ncbi:nucleolar pre-ribosomal-associated protein 1-like [Acridotheres tristis]
MVRELVHSFLMDLCCSLKHGITFCDPSLGTSGKGGNVVLLHFLLGLRPATEDQVVADLLICEAQPDISKSCKTSEFIPLPGLLSVAMVTTVPAVCNIIMLSKGLNLPSTVVKHSILSLVSMVLRRALRNTEHRLSEATWPRSQMHTLPAVQEFVQLCREAVSEVLPDMNNLVAVWQSLLKQKREPTDGQQSRRKVMSPL